MKITKDSLLEVQHCRKGRFTAIATRDFDTEDETFYPVKTTKKVRGYVNEWEPGEEIPCRDCLCTVKVIRQGAAV